MNMLKGQVVNKYNLNHFVTGICWMHKSDPLRHHLTTYRI